MSLNAVRPCRDVCLRPVRTLLLVLVPCLCLLIKGCHAPPISSPEGTATTYVQEGGVVVYAPRAARAQKVVFDTVDRQMIHEPDTLFRKFFNSRSPDFADGKLDYAKTTIIEDVVSMIDNREFIKQTVEDCIARHLNTAIRPPEETPDTAARRKENARRLAAAVYQALVRENYPDVRDDDVGRILGQFYGGRHQNDEHKQDSWDIWHMTTRDPKEAGKALDALALDLRVTLRERHYFRHVVDAAVDKRLALFRSGGRGDSARNHAQDVIESFIGTIASVGLTKKLLAGRESLWQAFLAGQNGDDGVERNLREAAADKPLSAYLLTSFGKSLRKQVIAELDRTAGLAAAMDRALVAHGRYLRILNSEGEPVQDPLSAKRKVWVDAVKTRKGVDKSRDALAAVAEQIAARSASYTQRRSGTATARRACRDAQNTAAGCRTMDDQADRIEKLVATISTLRAAWTAWETQKPIDPVPQDDAAQTFSTAELADVVYRMTAKELTDEEARKPVREAWLQVAQEVRKINGKLEVIAGDGGAGDVLRGNRRGLSDSEEPDVEARNILQKIADYTEYRTQLMETALHERVGRLADAAQAAADGKPALADASRLAFMLSARPDRDRERVNSMLEHLIVQDLGAHFERVVTAATTLRNAEDAERIAAQDLEQVQARFDTALGSVDDPDAASLLGQVDEALMTANATLPPETQIDLAKAAPRAHEQTVGYLRPLRLGKGGNEFPSIDSILDAGLKGVVTDDTQFARERMASVFERTFKGYAELISTDTPMLAALIQTARPGLASPDRVRTAASRIPKKLRAESEDLLAEGDPPSVKEVVKELSDVLNTPNVYTLFGEDTTRAAIVRAFKAEFVNAFRHRLAEARADEREAAYDYWWLTFHPKAVPLGIRKLAGESVIEIGFPQQVVPQEQYHRWLQDRLPGRSAASSGPNVRNALAVLRDFMAILDASSLSGRYPDIRPALLEALATMSGGRSGHGTSSSAKENTREGKTSDPSVASYRKAVETLHKRWADAFQDVLNREQRNFERRHRDLADRVKAAIDRVKAGTEADGAADELLSDLRDEEAELYKKIREIAMKRYPENGSPDRPPHEQTQRREGEVHRAEKQIRGLLMLAGRLNKTNPWGEFYEAWGTGTGCHKSRREDARLFLAWEHFDLRHVVFGLISAADSDAALPHKLELYAQAYFDGSRRFATKLTPQERRPHWEWLFGVEDIFTTDRYLVPFSRTEEVAALKRYIVLKGGARSHIEKLRVDFEGLRGAFRGALGISTSNGVAARLDVTNRVIAVVADLPPDVRASLTAQCLAAPDSLDGDLRTYGLMPPRHREQLKRTLFWGVEYWTDARRSPYVKFPQLWLWESRLDQAREALRLIVVNTHYTAYPGIPSVHRIRDEFLEDDRWLPALIYQWLRPFWLACQEGKGRHGERMRRALATRILFRESGERRTEGRYRRGSPEDVLGRAQRLPDLTPDAQRHVWELVTRDDDIYAWIEGVLESRVVLDQLRSQLVDLLYGDLWETCGQLHRLERHHVVCKSIKNEHYRRFREWAKPREQKMIQIVDMLPASRDDLVSMAINQGGVMANAAGKAEAAAAYDLNKVRMALMGAQTVMDALDSTLGSTRTAESESKPVPKWTSADRIETVEKLRALSKIKQEGEAGLYSLGAAARGDIFGRARAAMAYAKRREYLDAAITAAGRGDSFAKWVVRPSDVRAELAKGLIKKPVGLGHHGYPNGDQPFHMLVKIPHAAQHRDWDGTRYILFNSAYTATRRTPAMDFCGPVGVLAKAVLFPLYPRSWKAVEERHIGTVFPFKWDIRGKWRRTEEWHVPYWYDSAKQPQRDLLQEPNILGGRLTLDDTDKVKFSEVAKLIDAEARFIELTREAQSKELGEAIGALEPDAKGFRKKVQQSLEQSQEMQKSLYGSVKERLALQERRQRLREGLPAVPPKDEAAEAKAEAEPEPASSSETPGDGTEETSTETD